MHLLNLFFSFSYRNWSTQIVASRIASNSIKNCNGSPCLSFCCCQLPSCTFWKLKFTTTVPNTAWNRHEMPSNDTDTMSKRRKKWNRFVLCEMLCEIFTIIKLTKKLNKYWNYVPIYVLHFHLCFLLFSIYNEEIFRCRRYLVGANGCLGTMPPLSAVFHDCSAALNVFFFVFIISLFCFSSYIYLN